MDSALLALPFRWLAFFLVLGTVALPATAALLAPLDGRGAGLAFPAGAAVAALVTFWTGHLTLGPLNAVLGVAVLAVLSVAALRAGVAVPWRRYGEAAAVFTGVFLLATLVRASHPNLAIWAEMYLDLGLIQSVLRAPVLPLEDMWLAGRSVQYYYGGHLTVATWGMLTGTAGRYLPNLGLAAVHAMLVTGAYSLAGALAAERGADRRVAGAVGALLVGFAGNLYTPIRLVHAALPAGPARVLRESLSLSAEELSGGFDLFEATHFATTNTDFPVYSLGIQSLHPHVMVQPISLLAVATFGAYFLTPAGRRRARFGRLLAAGVVAGLVGFTNVWSFPMIAGLAAVTVALAPAGPLSLVRERFRPELPRLLRALTRYAGGAVAGLLVVGVGAVAVAPFLLVTDASRPLRLFPDRSGVRLFVVGYGAFLAAFALYLGPRLAGDLRDRGQVLAAAVGAVLVAAAWFADAAALAFVAPLLLAGWWLVRRGGAGFETVLVVAGAGLALLVEVVYVQEPSMPGRYNTLYKVHSQVWLLWSVAAGAAVAGVVRDAARSFRARSPVAGRLPGGLRVPLPDGGTDGSVRLRDVGRVAVIVVLLVGVSLYGVGIVGGILTNDNSVAEPTLDATAFADTEHPDQAAAVDWLAARQGRPTVVAHPPRGRILYTFDAAPAPSLTGLPAVAGWSHAANYHSTGLYQQRRQAVETIYTGNWSAAADRLAEHEVRYVYVGPIERDRYGNVSFAGLRGVEVAVRAGNVTIYAVDQVRLAVRASYRGQERSPGPSVTQALREQYCSKPADQRPAWTSSLCERGDGNTTASPSGG